MDELLSKIKRINSKKEIITLAKDIGTPERIPTGSISLDLAIGGGWPIGRIVTLWGPKGSTKTTLALHGIKNAQALGKQSLFIDAEQSFDGEWAKKIGIDTETLPVITNGNLRDILDSFQTENLAKDIDMVVVDSISSIFTDKYLNEDDRSIGSQAKATKEIMIKLQYWNSKCLIMLISQQTIKMANQAVYNYWTGGNALDHLSSLIVGLHSNIKSKDEQIIKKISIGDKNLQKLVGQKVRWKVEKSRISIPLEEGQYKFYIDNGQIDERYELVRLGIVLGVIDTSGSWLSFNGIKVQGIENFEKELEDDSILELIRNEVFEKTKTRR